MTVAVVEADHAEAVDQFLVEARLPQWNSVRVLPSLPLEAGMREIAEGTTLF
jgi:hypothetical protein